MKQIDWKKVPKGALTDAMRAINLGPSNLSVQRKADLIDVVDFHMRNWPETRREQFIILLNMEVGAYHRRQARRETAAALRRHDETRKAGA